MRVSKTKLTDSYVAKLKPGQKPGAPKGASPAKYCVWDAACPGFGVEVTTQGRKLLVVKTCRDGVRGWHTLGWWGESGMLNVEEARAKAYALKDQVKKGEDPRAAIEAKKAATRAERLAYTVSELADRFIAEHICAKVTKLAKGFSVEVLTDKNGKPIGNKPSTAREHVRLIEHDIKPALGEMAVKKVGTSDIASMLSRIKAEHPTLSNRIRSVLSKMFAKAELWELREKGSNPVKGQDKAGERKKERNLSDREIEVLGAHLKKLEDAELALAQGKGESPRTLYELAAIRLYLLTGMRKAELIGDSYRSIPALTWDDVDLDAGLLHCHHKTETRTGKKRTVYLCTAAVDLLADLQRQPRTLGNPCVIPGERRGHAIVNLQLAWDRIRKQATQASLEEAKKNGQTKPEIDITDVTIHDLRRTFASVGARLGVPELWIGALLGHSAQTITQGYARVNSDPLRVAVEDIGKKIQELLSGDFAEPTSTVAN